MDDGAAGGGATADAAPAPARRGERRGSHELRAPTDAEYALFQRLVHGALGVHLGPSKRPLLVSRLGKRVRELGLASFGDYYRAVVQDAKGEELAHLADLITTNETSFFREIAHFDFVRTVLVPRWRAAADAGQRPRRLRAWSAACSTGQEPYSLAMVLCDALPAEDGWEVEIIGTDLSRPALARAASATWPIEKAGPIPQHYLRRYMLRGTGPRAGEMRAGPTLRAAVQLRWANLVAPAYPVEGSLDLIFCRNVLIYFTPDDRRRVIERLAGMLAPGGHLVLGHAEGARAGTETLRSAGPTTYVRPAPEPA